MHLGLLWNFMGKKSQRTNNGMWSTPAAGEVLRESGMQKSNKYTGRRQGTVYQWVDQRNIFEMCAQEQGFEGGRQRRRSWWRQEALKEFLREKLMGVLREAWMRWGWWYPYKVT